MSCLAPETENKQYREAVSLKSVSVHRSLQNKHWTDERKDKENLKKINTTAPCTRWTVIDHRWCQMWWEQVNGTQGAP